MPYICTEQENAFNKADQEMKTFDTQPEYLNLRNIVSDTIWNSRGWVYHLIYRQQRNAFLALGAQRVALSKKRNKALNALNNCLTYGNNAQGFVPGTGSGNGSDGGGGSDEGYRMSDQDDNQSELTDTSDSDDSDSSDASDGSDGNGRGDDGPTGDDRPFV